MYDLTSHLARHIAVSRNKRRRVSRLELLRSAREKLTEIEKAKSETTILWVELIRIAFDGAWRSISEAFPARRANHLSVEITEHLIREQADDEWSN